MAFTFEDNLTKEEFLELAKTPGVKTNFQCSYTWGEVMSRRGWTPYYVGVKEDGRVVASALLLQKRLYMGYTYFYIPRGFTMDYSRRDLLKFMTEGVDRFCKAHKSIYFKIDPDIKLQTIDLDGNVIEGEANWDLVEDLKKMGYKQKPLNYFFENEAPRFTFRIPLDDPMEEIEARYSRTTKARIKQANQAGVEVYEGTAEEIPEFVRLMEMTEKRQDFFSHEGSYYQYFYDILKKDDMVTLYFGKIDVPKVLGQRKEEKEQLIAESEELKEKIAAAEEGRKNKKAESRLKEVEKKITALDKQIDLLAEKPQEEVIVSTYLISKYMDKSWALYAANDMDYGKFFANYAVYQRQIRDAKEEGRKVFDVFGTIGKPDADSRLVGLYEFKKKWGGEYTEFIGEFDYIENRLMYTAYKTLIPMYHKMQNKRLRKQVQQSGE